MESEPDLSDFKDQLAELEIKHISVKNRRFLPQQRLYAFLTVNKIDTILGTCQQRLYIQPYNCDEARKLILRGGFKILAILLSKDLLELGYLQCFVQADTSNDQPWDAKLPLELEAVKSIFAFSEKNRARCSRHAQAFYDEQWKYIVPIFERDQSHREFPAETILPFVRKEPLSPGAFAEVDKVGIPSEHQRINLDMVGGEVIVVRKRLKYVKNVEESFHAERHILSLVRCLQHPNIVKLLASYTFQSTYNFLFELAEGNLQSLMEEDQRPRGFENDESIFKAMFELCSALDAFHRYDFQKYSLKMIGCHYDFNPRNILYRRGTFLLSDFGLSRMRNIEEDSGSIFRLGNGDYLAPECKDLKNKFVKGRIGRSGDIWSFGAVILDLLTYMMTGSEGVKSFRRDRQFESGPGHAWTYYLFHAGNKDSPHPTVLRCISEFKKSSKAGGIYASIAELVEEMLHLDPEARPSSQTAMIRLFKSNIVLFRHASLSVSEIEISQRYPLEFQIEKCRLEVWIRSFLDSTEKGHGSAHLHTMGTGSAISDFLRRVQAILEAVRKELQELQYALNRGGPQNHGVCQNLRVLIDSLWRTMPEEEVVDMNRAVENIIFEDDSFKNIDIHAGLKDHGPYEHLKQMVLVRKIEQAISNTSGELGAHCFQRAEFESDGIKIGYHALYRRNTTDIRIQSDTSSESGFRENKGTVLIEMMRYDDGWVDRTDELVTRIQSIASGRSICISPEFLPVLKCTGYFHEKLLQRFGLVYELPIDIDPNINLPKSLLELMHEGTPAAVTKAQTRSIEPGHPKPAMVSLERRPTLSQRFDLALQVASMVFEISKANMVHKGISTGNFILFPEKAGSDNEDIFSLRLYLIGFNYSRPNNAEAFSQGWTEDERELRDYQYPEYLEKGYGYLPVHDFYSAAIVLLEIGLWQQVTGNRIKGNLKVMRDTMLRKYIPRLGFYMGRAYQEAVRLCLTLAFEDINDKAHILKYERGVLLPIRRRLFDPIPAGNRNEEDLIRLEGELNNAEGSR
ncbi:hypothetical protein ABW19_dt0208523 [Dactylella cylindrospora]|nr:hypothetical protein ABW19_dt0208523 [Dactylella cylindrospora]